MSDSVFQGVCPVAGQNSASPSVALGSREGCESGCVTLVGLQWPCVSPGRPPSRAEPAQSCVQVSSSPRGMAAGIWEFQEVILLLKWVLILKIGHPRCRPQVLRRKCGRGERPPMTQLLIYSRPTYRMA